MEIYIRGMEMPKSCDTCPMNLRDLVGQLCCRAESCIVLRKKNQERPDWCPLVPDPPHGRLIDADALERVVVEAQKQAEYYDERARQLVCDSGEVSQYTWAVSLRETYRRFVKALEEIDAPTIIEAEEG